MPPEAPLPDAGPLVRAAAALAHYQPALRVGEAGRVAAVGDGIAWVEGLPSAAAEDLVRFDNGARGMVFELDARRLGVILLDPDAAVAAGMPVALEGGRLVVGAGAALRGRVVDPLGRALDGGVDPQPEAWMPLEAPSPPIAGRRFVDQPLVTGVTVIDTVIPIGRGQRQLLIGDAGTGKTSLALDAVIAQASQGVRCVLVLIGTRRSEAASLIELLHHHGAMAHTTVVMAEATATPGLKMLAPFAGCAIAEHDMRRGLDTLVVYDDLSTHARAWRELSLLMQRPPGREAYPGDIFHLHARLLERATRLTVAQGGGSLTALPVVQTEEGEIAAYIPTNLISITDGQVYLDRRLFSAGVLPAVDVALSVSRIGGKAQHPRMRQEAGRMKLEYLQFLELEVFTRFGTRLEADAQARIARGRVLREVFRQDRLDPLPAAFQMAWLVAFNSGLMGGLAPSDVPAALGRLRAGLQDDPLDLDAPRERWLERVTAWLGGRPAPATRSPEDALVAVATTPIADAGAGSGSIQGSGSARERAG